MCRGFVTSWRRGAAGTRARRRNRCTSVSAASWRRVLAQPDASAGVGSTKLNQCIDLGRVLAQTAFLREGGLRPAQPVHLHAPCAGASRMPARGRVNQTQPMYQLGPRPGADGIPARGRVKASSGGSSSCAVSWRLQHACAGMGSSKLNRVHRRGPRPGTDGIPARGRARPAQPVHRHAPCAGAFGTAARGLVHASSAKASSYAASCSLPLNQRVARLPKLSR